MQLDSQISSAARVYPAGEEIRVALDKAGIKKQFNVQLLLNRSKVCQYLSLNTSNLMSSEPLN